MRLPEEKKIVFIEILASLLILIQLSTLSLDYEIQEYSDQIDLDVLNLNNHLIHRLENQANFQFYSELIYHDVDIYVPEKDILVEKGLTSPTYTALTEKLVRGNITKGEYLAGMQALHSKHYEKNWLAYDKKQKSVLYRIDNKPFIFYLRTILVRVQVIIVAIMIVLYCSIHQTIKSRIKKT